jgi:cell division protein FtsB
MLDYGQKRKFRSFLYNRYILGFLGLLVILAVHSTWNVYQKQRESVALLRVAQGESSVLKAREQELQTKIASMQTEQGMEEEIRSKFNVAKPGENVVVVLDQSDATTSTSTTTISFWQSILNFFK